jgi:hypothetical protein
MHFFILRLPYNIVLLIIEYIIKILAIIYCIFFLQESAKIAMEKMEIIKEFITAQDYYSDFFLNSLDSSSRLEESSDTYSD